MLNSSLFPLTPPTEGTTEIERAIQKSGFTQAAACRIPGREAKLANTLPDALHPTIRQLISGRYPNGLYSHQAAALETSLAGNDICLTTSTAGGKSLVFMTAAADLVMRDAQATVLVFYPLRALIQDQLQKWAAILKPLNMRPAFIDGSIKMSQREDLLSQHRVVLMTPDVTHAWFMSNLNNTAIATFRRNLRLLILDEVHVYEGVFGTNMAFFLRRLQAVCGEHRLICCSATLGKPADFIFQLTGRTTREYGPDTEGSPVPTKTIMLLHPQNGDGFNDSVGLIQELARNYSGRFLAFADSRRMVELVTAAVQRPPSSGSANSGEANPDIGKGVHPYRSGYENEDRLEILTALTDGTLRGVVSTSALELGLDIGEIDFVLLLNTPPSIKAFWQRAGRAGRQREGFCAIIDSHRMIGSDTASLKDYLSRPVDPNWLYLPNRYAQYANVLCAAAETQQVGNEIKNAYFDSLPLQFKQYLTNELNPTEMVPTELYPLKQAAQNGPHREFPLRSGAEKDFQVYNGINEKKGNLSFSQALREAYPGAIYYYMAERYRVIRFSYAKGKIEIIPDKHHTTKPIMQTMVFPDFRTGILRLWKSATGFLAEAELQVSERVTGFRETEGRGMHTQNYGPKNMYSQTPIIRYIRTTGVCWFLPQTFMVSEGVAEAICDTFCAEYGIQSRDVDFGRFYAQQTPLGNIPTNGMCIFDSSNGSLHLTERLGQNFVAIVKSASTIADTRGNTALRDQLYEMILAITDCSRSTIAFDAPQIVSASQPTDLVTVIAREQKAMMITPDGAKEVTVKNYFYSPKGIVYDLHHPNPSVKFTAPAELLQPINGVTTLISYDVMTGEEHAV